MLDADHPALERDGRARADAANLPVAERDREHALQVPRDGLDAVDQNRPARIPAKAPTDSVGSEGSAPRSQPSNSRARSVSGTSEASSAKKPPLVQSLD